MTDPTPPAIRARDEALTYFGLPHDWCARHPPNREHRCTHEIALRSMVWARMRHSPAFAGAPLAWQEIAAATGSASHATVMQGVRQLQRAME